MSLRERLLYVLGILGAIGLVVYPLAYRITSADTAGGGVVDASVAPTPTATPLPTATPAPTPSMPDLPRIDALWVADATPHRGQDGATYAYECSSDGTLGQIWGTDIYTDDTWICTAGVHAGVITQDEGGTVTIIIRPGQASYAGSVRNGVASQPYEAWQGSYEVVVP